MQLVVRVAETVWRPHGDSARTARLCPQRMRSVRPQRRPSHPHRTPSRLLRRASSRHMSWYGAGIGLARLCAPPMDFETRSAHHQPTCLRDSLAFRLKRTRSCALRQPLDVAEAATNRRDRAPMSEATCSSWMQLVVCVAETVWRPHGDSARTAVATARSHFVSNTGGALALRDSGRCGRCSHQSA